VLTANLEMADRNASITIALSQPLRLELARIARNAETTEGALIQQAVEALVQAGHRPEIPRYARRLGPIAIAEDNRPARVTAAE